MLSTASRPIGGKDNLPKRHTAWPNLQPQNIEAARGSNPHQKHQAAGLGFLLTHFARNELGSNAAIGVPLLCPCTDTETKDGPGAELLPTPGRSYVAPSRPVAALGRYQAACARSSSGPACDDSGYRRITVAHPFRPRDPWRRRGGMGTGSGTVSQVAPLVRFTQSCDQAGTAASSGRALSWEIVPLCIPRPISRLHLGTAGINRSNTAVRAVLKQPCLTGGRTGTVRPKHLPPGRTGLSDQFLGPVTQDQPGPVGQICPTSWLLLWSDSARPTTSRTRLFEHRSNCRV
ncbi:hypothetical protein PCANC_21503 [Puccinia coronata f. sp. avenae]|uniref:Uncharacterized protein n=1 Tax=Puccinia coronata f. sp. avenae TaxID=200324 RepID=A0A2N5S8B9_9BASI|nr:hypothetical protein PCANC_21503 [Puccinia coronata f. sp. avenae]